MFATDSMEYGVFRVEVPLPEDFSGPYPVRCGYHQSRAPFTVGTGDEAALVYLLRGEGAAEYAGQSGDYFGGCVLLAPTVHLLTVYPAEETEYLFVLLQNADWMLAQAAAEGFVRETSGGRIDRLLGRLCYRVSQRQEGTVYALSAEVYALLMELLETCAPHQTVYPALVRRAMAFMREEYAFLTGVDELAERLEVSASHLIRVFSDAMGTSPGKYLQNIKLDNAKLMLQNRAYTIDMVADMAGFSGANYFCKVFRRATGESPGQYRARQTAISTLDAETHARLTEIEQKAHL